MNMKEMQLLSDAELKEIAKEKGKKGNASTKAKTAQKILWERSGNPYNSNLYRDPYGSKDFRTADKMNGWE